MSFTIYIGNVPRYVDEKQLTELFSRHGNVLGCTLKRDSGNGKTKTYAFMDVEDIPTAKDMIFEMDGYRLGGSMLVVRKATRRNAPKTLCEIFEEDPEENKYNRQEFNRSNFRYY